MLTVLIEYGVKMGFMTCKYILYWMYYGGEYETNEEKILHKLKEIEEENHELKDQLQMLLVNGASEKLPDIETNI